MPYRLRFFFDSGSGVCLWTANDAARERFGYPVELDELPLSDETRRAGEHLIERFDTSLDWSDPSGRTIAWNESDAASFEEAASAWLIAASEELGRDFEIVDEHSVRRAT